MKFKYFLRNGTLTPISKATIPLDNILYQYGYGVYETLKVRDGILYFVKEHIERLKKSAKLLGLKHQLKNKDLRQQIYKLVKNNIIKDCNIKILLIGGKTAKESQLFVLPLPPLLPDGKLYLRGASLESVNYERFLPNAKTLSMLRSFLYLSHANKKGFYDALLLDDKNNILEGTRTNFFVMIGKTIFTAPRNKALEGVTRQTLIFVAKKNGFKVIERNISIKKLNKFDSAFLTSTSSNIIPVTKIDNYKLNISLQLKELMKIYDDFLINSRGLFRG